MYWLLNYLPLIMQIVIHSIPLVSKISLNINFGLYMVISCFILPIYLLLVNGYYIKSRVISYKLGIVCMISVVLLNVLVFLISHKIRHGTFIGDVPEGLYYLWVGIPCAIMLIGMAIYYFVNRK